MEGGSKAWIPTLKIFRDPVHGYIALDSKEYEYLGPLIDSPEFQRLRRILQLGTTRLTYHGAEHSRFGHCLGMMWIIRNIIRRFRGDGVDVSEDMERNALTAALLHDIGHGPLSHVFEHLTENMFDHEKMGLRLIKESPLKEKVAEPDKVADLLGGLAPAPFRWIGDLLSGALDADKMDYLSRDSYYTGTDYGRFDFQRLSQSLMVYESKGTRYLAVIEKGISAAEAFVLARDRMYWSVYYHKTTRGVEKLLTSILERAKDTIQEGEGIQMGGTLAKVLSGGQLEPEDMMDFDDLALENQLRVWKRSEDPVLAPLCKRYFNRDLFKARIVPDNKFELLTERRETIDEKIHALGLDPRYYWRTDRPELLAYRAPYTGEEGDRIMVVSATKDGRVERIREITTYSRAVRALEQKGEFRVHSTREGINEIARVIGL